MILISTIIAPVHQFVSYPASKQVRNINPTPQNIIIIISAILILNIHEIY